MKLYRLSVMALGLAAVPADGAVQLLRSFMTKAVPTDACSPTPTPTTSFSTNDAAAWLWFEISQGATGDVARSEWFDPNGRLLSRPGGPWEALESPGAYCFSEKLTVSGNPAAIQGTWTVKVFWNNASLFTLTFTISAAGGPAIASGGIVNAASYSPAISAGAMVALYGQRLAARTVAASAVPLPEELEGVRVEIREAGKNPVRAPLYFVSAGQINFQMPFGLTASSVEVRVVNPAGESPWQSVALQATSPALFTLTMDGKGTPTMVHATDWRWVEPSYPARPGEYLLLMVTGLGPIRPAIAAGRPGGDNGANGPLNYCTNEVTVTIGGKNAPVLFAGLMPGFPGIYQINVQAPPDLPAGTHSVVVRSANRASQDGVTAAFAACGLEVTAAVGPAGGVVATEGIRVEVPAGAFTGTTTLGIGRGIEPQGAVTPAFTLSGLPEDIKAPITVRVKLSAQPGSEPLLALVDKIILEAGVEGDSAVLTLPLTVDPPASLFPAAAAGYPPRAAESAPPQDSLSTGDVGFYITSFYAHTDSAGQHFRIFYPKNQGLDRYAQDVGAGLESAYGKLAQLGFDWTRRKRWPINVVFHPFSGEDVDKFGYSRTSLWGTEYSTLHFNSTKFPAGMSRELQATTGHELFHLLQDLYDPRRRTAIAWSQPAWLWMLEAASTWFEGLAVDDPNYLPPTVQNSNWGFMTQHGLEMTAGPQGEVQGHGYGASMFLNWLTRKCGGTLVWKTFDQYRYRAPGLFMEPRYSAAEALAAAVLDCKTARDLNSEWLEFCQRVWGGPLYGGAFPTQAHLLQLGAQRFSFTDTDDPPSFTQTWSAPDLSARLFVVRLFKKWPGKTTLKLELSDPGGMAQMMIWRVSSGGRWTFVAATRGPQEFQDGETMAANGEQLVVLVGNGNGRGKYQGSTQLTFSVKKEGGVDLWQMLRSTTAMSHVIRSRNTVTGAEFQAGTWAAGNISGLRWSGNAFSVDYKYTDASTPGTTWQYSVNGALSADGKTLTQLHYRESMKKDRKYDQKLTPMLEYVEQLTEWDVRNVPVDVPTGGFTGTEKILTYSVYSDGPPAVQNYTCSRKAWSGPEAFFPGADKLTPSACSALPTGTLRSGVVTQFIKP